MRPGMSRIMRVPKANARNHLLHHFEEIILGSLPDFTGRQGRRRVGHKENAKALLHSGGRDGIIDSGGHIDRFLCARSFDTQKVSHVVPMSIEKHPGGQLHKTRRKMPARWKEATENGGT